MLHIASHYSYGTYNRKYIAEVVSLLMGAHRILKGFLLYVWVLGFKYFPSFRGQM